MKDKYESDSKVLSDIREILFNIREDIFDNRHMLAKILQVLERKK
jgi:hypothetical protein